MADDLHTELRLLRAAVDALRVEIARDYTPRRELARQRRRGALLLLGVLMMLAAGGYVTERVTLSHEHRLVAACFLTTPTRPDRCEREFPGYQATRAQSQATLRQFAELQQRVATLEADKGH